MTAVTFASLEEGQPLGRHDWTPDEAAIADYRALYGPAGGDALPAGLVTVAVMRAFMAALDGAPPGSIHAGQKTTLERLPRRGETMSTEIACTGKEIRRDRRWLTFRFTVLGHRGSVIAHGVNRSIFPY